MNDLQIFSLVLFNVFESRISESKIKDGIFFSLSRLDPNLIISNAFMSLNFLVLDFVPLI